jgi:hypothetical protein
MISIQRANPQNISAQASKTNVKYQTYLTGSAAPFQSLVEGKFNELMSKLLTTEVQNRTAYDIANQLIRISPTTIKIHFELAKEENEIVFVAENEKAQNIIVLDEEGDIMISHSPFLGNGWREFVDNKKIDFESVTYKFLSL